MIAKVGAMGTSSSAAVALWPTPVFHPNLLKAVMTPAARELAWELLVKKWRHASSAGQPDLPIQAKLSEILG
ncbi:hypothetical protein BaRGS_00025016 [Batillaria attramentaria]|uniref:Uncharacterized protein n=1 Tax=Batillaria attramentaria TaxID=370345 RepID=A0ABD0K9G3_9CAEN